MAQGAAAKVAILDCDGQGRARAELTLTSWLAYPSR